MAGEIFVDGLIDASGANGGTASTTYCYYGGGGGGGGAGGAIWLHGDRVSFTGELRFNGGNAGTGRPGRSWIYEGTNGGAGSVGRARISGQVITETGTATERPWVDKATPSCETPFEEEEE